MSEQKSLENITRRDFFKTGGKSLLHISGLIGLNVGVGLFRAFNNNIEATDIKKESDEIKLYTENKTQDNKKKSESYNNSEDIKTNTPTLQVKHFAHDIYRSSQQLDTHNNAILYGLGAFTLGDFTGSVALLHREKKLKAIIGGSALALGKFIDLYSTYRFAEVMENSKFREYGLHNYYFENNPLFSQDPTRREVLWKGSLLTGLSYFIGTQVPWLGTGYLALSPFIAVTNLDGRAKMMYALKLGEQVETMIPNNNYNNIANYIYTMNPKKMLLDIYDKH